MTANFEDAWRDTAIPAETFALDAIFEIACIGGSERFDAIKAAMQGSVQTLSDALGQSVPASGKLPCAIIAGHEASLAAYYRALIEIFTARGWGASLESPFPWFAITPSIRNGDTNLFAFSYLDSAIDALHLFGILQNAPSAPDGVLFDDLEQGWMIYIEKYDGKILVAEWDWEDNAAVPDVFSFDLEEVAAQAARALVRLTSVHAALTNMFAHDHWNFRRPTPQATGIWKLLNMLGFRRPAN